MGYEGGWPTTLGIVFLMLSQFVAVITSVPLDSIEDMFAEFIRHHRKSYGVHSAEYSQRLVNFQESLKRHAFMNNGSVGVKYGMNTLSDMSPSEFKSVYLHGSSSKTRVRRGSSDIYSTQGLVDAKSLPAKWDWRDKGVVTAVKDQKHCGGCWAFSATETIESAYALQWGSTPAPSLSVQQVIDCATYNYGCNGGSVGNAFSWMISSHTALVPDNQYPVTDKSEYCTFFRNPTEGVLLTNFSCNNFHDNEDLVRQLLYSYGPLSVGVDATTWQDYLGGIVQWHCGESLNHAVQLIGYDMTGAIPYYIVRNSWSADWGNEGYVYIKVGSNVCGIAYDVCGVTGTTATH